MYKFDLIPPNIPSKSSSYPSSNGTDDSGVDTGLASSPPTETCLVCGAETRGMHFQVASCRACAAFYRRSVKAKKVYKCRRGNRNCDLTKPPNGKPICRFCRLQKCYAVGMRMDHASMDDPALVTVRESSSVSPERGKLRVTNGNRLEMNINKLVAELKDYFRGEREVNFIGLAPTHMTSFQQLQLGFAKLREHVCPSGPIPISETYNKIAMYPFQEEYVKLLGQMLMSLDPFVQLCFQDRWKLFQHSWPLIYQIERQFSSCDIFGFDVNQHRILITKDLAVDITKAGVYIDGMDPHKLEELMKFCFPLKQGISEMIEMPIKQLQLSQFEICYVVGLIIFSAHDVRGLTNQAKQICEEIIDQFSSELHNYYTYELKLSNYAGRHAKLIRLISCAHQVLISIKDYMTMAKIFDIFVVDIYESELYE